MTRAKFTFRITYFDAHGVWKMTDNYEYNALMDARKLPIMQHVASHIRGKRDVVGQGDPLPAGWQGHILIECKGCKPVLVLRSS